MESQKQKNIEYKYLYLSVRCLERSFFFIFLSVFSFFQLIPECTVYTDTKTNVLVHYFTVLTCQVMSTGIKYSKTFSTK